MKCTLSATTTTDNSQSTTGIKDTSEISPRSSSWKLEGDYFEGCNCDIVCPCVYLLDPDEGNCHVTCAWHIQKGNYGNTDLSNLNVVALFDTPGNMATGPKWKAALYIDGRATQEQKDLILKIYSGQAGGFFAVAHNFIGEMLGVKSVPIEFGMEGKRRWLRVKDALELDTEAIEGGDKSRDSVVSNVPFTVVPGADMTVARSSKYNYNDYGMEWNNSGKNSFHCRFKYSP